MPDWLGQAMVGAAAAVLGFFGKWYWDKLQKERGRHDDRVRQLRSLRDLLQESGSIFRSQNYQARRLMTLLRARLGDALQTSGGFDATFYTEYPSMEAEERELHSLIRSTTVNSLRRTNEAFAKWLDDNHEFKADDSSPARKDFAEQLRALELHINQWHDKYAAMIADDERRSLVYLADEKRHGMGFPDRIDVALGEAIQDYVR